MKKNINISKESTAPLFESLGDDILESQEKILNYKNPEVSLDEVQYAQTYKHINSQSYYRINTHNLRFDIEESDRNLICDRILLSLSDDKFYVVAGNEVFAYMKDLLSSKHQKLKLFSADQSTYMREGSLVRNHSSELDMMNELKYMLPQDQKVFVPSWNLYQKKHGSLFDLINYAFNAVNVSMNPFTYVVLADNRKETIMPFLRVKIKDLSRKFCDDIQALVSPLLFAFDRPCNQFDGFEIFDPFALLVKSKYEPIENHRDQISDEERKPFNSKDSSTFQLFPELTLTKDDIISSQFLYPYDADLQFYSHSPGSVSYGFKGFIIEARKRFRSNRITRLIYSELNTREVKHYQVLHIDVLGFILQQIARRCQHKVNFPILLTLTGRDIFTQSKNLIGK